MRAVIGKGAELLGVLFILPLAAAHRLKRVSEAFVDAIERHALK